MKLPRSRWKKVLLIFLVCDVITIPIDVLVYHHVASINISCTDKGQEMMGRYVCDKLSHL